MVEHDLSFVAPKKRDEVLRRIGTIGLFLAAPGRAAADDAAADLGLSSTQFYRLARVWREHRTPALLAGSARPRPLRSLASTTQLKMIDAASAELPDAPVERVAMKALALADAAGIAMPALNAVRKVVEMRRVGRVSPSSPAVGAKIVVTTCAIDLPVLIEPCKEPVMPIATLVIDTTPTAGVIGLSLGVATPLTTLHASALSDALGHIAPDEAATSMPATLKIAIERQKEPAWRNLVDSLIDTDLDVHQSGPTAHSVMHDAVALLGRKPAGFKLMPGLTSRPPSLRQPTESASAEPLTLREAETLVRSRLVDPHRPSPFRGTPSSKRRRMAADWADIKKA